MKVTFKDIDYMVAFTDLYSSKRYGKPAPRRPYRRNGIVILIESRFINMEA